MNALIDREQWDRCKGRLEAAVAKGSGVPVSGRPSPPVMSQRTIDCMAVNYMEDGTRSAAAPIQRLPQGPSAISIGNGDDMVLPDVPAPIFEDEAEIAAVIGRKC